MTEEKKEEQNQAVQEKYGPRIRFELEPWNPGYSPSVCLYDDGSMKICYEGLCVRMLVKKWMKLADSGLEERGK